MVRLAARLAVLATFAVAATLLGAGPSSAADSTPVLAGTYTGTLTLSDDWGGAAYGSEAGSRTYTFSAGCKVGSACTVTGQSGSIAMKPGGGGFVFSQSEKSACTDNATGALKSPSAFDFTYTIAFKPSATEVRGGTTYVTALTGTYQSRFAVNAVGRSLNCTVRPNSTQVETEAGTYRLTLAPLAKPKAVAQSAPLAITDPAGSASSGAGSSAGTGSGALPGVSTDPTATSTLPRFGLPMTETQRDNAEAVDAGRRSSVAGALVTPADAIASIQNRLGKDLLLLAILGLLLVFPAQLFNSTYEENSDRIKGFWRRGKNKEPKEPGRFRRVTVFVLVTILGALLAGFLDPSFGFNDASYALTAGVLLSVVVTLVVAVVAGGIYRSAARENSGWQLEALPGTLLFAALCVAVSRLTGFEPGYLYGALGGAAFLIAMEARKEAKAEVTAVVVTLLLALASWYGFAQVNAAANADGATFATLTGDAFLAALFVGGLEGLLFALVPITFLPGARIWAWSKVVWVLLFAVVGYLFVHVLLIPESGYLGRSSDASTAVTLLLFVVFGVISVLFWGYFKVRPTKDEPEQPEVGPWSPAEPAMAGHWQQGPPPPGYYWQPGPPPPGYEPPPGYRPPPGPPPSAEPPAGSGQEGTGS